MVYSFWVGHNKLSPLSDDEVGATSKWHTHSKFSPIVLFSVGIIEAVPDSLGRVKTWQVRLGQLTLELRPEKP